MKKTLFTALLILVAGLAFAQKNLVPNEGFDNYKKCPSDLGQIDRTDYWFTPSQGTPDFFGACSKGGKISLGVPENYMGSQGPKSGENYTGIISYSKRSPDYREYLAVELNSKLMADSIYYLRFHVSLADYSKFATDNIGACVTDSLVKQVSWLPVSLEPVLISKPGKVMSEKVDWIEISGQFVAKGGEEYLIIGNFKPDKEIIIKEVNTSPVDKSGQKAYYYVDDIMLYKCFLGDCSMK
ncbi:MAG: hypothetical protein A2W91_01470 [Bacteroidetes bacterium GWF2_38_335]|nr:MAG: hypothetical protein A2W91_01470 [Bacteroidetes bacterium GWF2_38_335]OFY78744.1 MAG: hypothetical protein A2281_19045 [Bacteroidetes bacterium RIFOXYA12_FULL_38_20]HBS85132.1 hypothetical protein [Bacteroidales bacterium]